jgi:hypothetical protein
MTQEPITHHHIETRLLLEQGIEEALQGMALSYKDSAEPFEAWWTAERRQKALSRAAKLAPRGGGHNKFLESIILWVYVRAPRYWWQEAATYRHTSTNSGSTMHTLAKRPAGVEGLLDLREMLAADDVPDAPTGLADFEPGTPLVSVMTLNALIRQEAPLCRIKAALPEGYLQDRIIRMDYMTLRNMYWQRRNHRLPHWQDFLNALLANIQHPEYITNE